MQRRRILKRGIGAVGGISMATTVVSADESIDTDFDPDSDAEIKEFARQFRQLSQRRRQEVYASLNKERKAAAKKAFAPAYAVSSTTSLGGVTQTGNTNKQATLSGYSALGFHLWDWYHEVDWDHDGSSVSDISYFDYADIYDSTWSYDGTVSKNLDDDGYKFEAFRQ